jgi:hypothetical protein
MKTKSRLCVLVGMTAACAWLTSCTSASSAPKVSQPQQIYQPRVLQLRAGQPVPTAAGIYIPQTDEVWNSAAAYNQLEEDNINLAAALAQERNRNNP